MGGKMGNIFEGIINTNFKISSFKKVIEHLFDLELNYEEEEEGNDLLVDLIKFCMNSLHGQSMRKDMDEEYILRSENWFVKNNDERVVDHEALPNA